MSSQRSFAFARGFFRGQWFEPFYAQVDEVGRVTYVGSTLPESPVDSYTAELSPVDPRTFIQSPANGHSHCFQFAIVGLTERAVITDDGRSDDFWAWREAMYSAALSISPEDLRAIARALYSLMKINGYRSVTEFHYLHNDRDGSRYEQRTLLADVLIEAALEVGLNIVMTPVYYREGGFNRPASAEQRRFTFSDVDDYLDLIARLDARWGAHPYVKIGKGAHSLRAVSPEDLRVLCESLEPERPFHIHIAEQVREVEECLAVRGARPVQWLMDHVEVDARYHLVHATHLDSAEIERIARSGAWVNLCPTTEGNLGDGVFPLREFLAARGRFWIGSDSHVTLSPFEELRTLDYSQRFAHRSRGVVNAVSPEHRGAILWSEALNVDEYGDQRGEFLSGVLLQPDNLITSSKPCDAVLSALVYGGDSSLIDAVILNGSICVRDMSAQIRADFARVLRAITL